MNNRIIARLDIKKNWLIKGVQLEGWRKIGDPSYYAEKYYKQGADELIYMDVVASLYQRNNLKEIVAEVAEKVFIPITVGGGIDGIKSASMLMKSGADKVAINTAATKNPNIIRELSDYYGSQAVVISIEAKKSGDSWIAMTENGRNHSGYDVLQWAEKCKDLGAGEIFVTSIDADGRKKGIDKDLINKLNSCIDIPLIYSGGFGNIQHIKESLDTGLHSVCLGSALHHEDMTINSIKESLHRSQYKIRYV